MKELNRTCKTQPPFVKPGSEQPFKTQRTPTRFTVSCDILWAGITYLNSVSLLLPITEMNCILWDRNAFLNIVTILLMACFCNPVDKEGNAITITSRITKRTLLAAKPSHVLSGTIGPPMPPDFTLNLYLYYSHPQWQLVQSLRKEWVSDFGAFNFFRMEISEADQGKWMFFSDRPSQPQSESSFTSNSKHLVICYSYRLHELLCYLESRKLSKHPKPRRSEAKKKTMRHMIFTGNKGLCSSNTT